MRKSVEFVENMMLIYAADGMISRQHYEMIVSILSPKEKEIMRNYMAAHGIVLETPEDRNSAGTVPLESLSNEELVQAYREHREGALEVLLNKNERLVKKYASEYARKTGAREMMEDLVSAGRIGLMKAAEKYDGERATRFSTYAVWWMRSEMTSELSNSRFSVHIPGKLFHNIRVVRREEEKLRCSRGQAGDSVGAIVRATEHTDSPLTRNNVLDVYQANSLMNNCVSLDRPVGKEENEISLGEFIPDTVNDGPEIRYEQVSMKSELSALLDHLDFRERMVIVQRYGLDGGGRRTLAEISAALGISLALVLRIEKKALGKLRIYAEKAGMREYLLA